MNIKYFKEKFIDWIDESNQLGIPATIELGKRHTMPYETLLVWGYTISGSKLTLLTVDDYRPSRLYAFTDKSIFDGIETVVFSVNGEEVVDFIAIDVSWSDRTFIFDGDF